MTTTSIKFRGKSNVKIRLLFELNLFTRSPKLNCRINVQANTIKKMNFGTLNPSVVHHGEIEKTIAENPIKKYKSFQFLTLCIVNFLVIGLSTLFPYPRLAQVIPF